MNELETHVLELIGEDPQNPDVFTDDDTGIAPIRDSLHDAIEEIAMVTASTRRKFYLPLHEDKTFYQIESSDDTDRFGWPVSVWLTSIKRRLEQKDLTWMGMNIPTWLKGSGSPIYYGMIGLDTIWTYPTIAGDSYSLEIDAVMIPKRYTIETDRVKVVEQYKWATVHYAVSEYWASRGDAKSATDHHMKYLEQLNLLKIHPSQYERMWGYKTEKTN